MKTKILTVCTLFFLTCVITSCAPSHGSSHEYGFFGGIIHGIVLPFALVAKLFGMKYGIYADHNSGFFYWLGFLIGFGGLGGSATRS